MYCSMLKYLKKNIIAEEKKWNKKTLNSQLEEVLWKKGKNKKANYTKNLRMGERKIFLL